jgi:hypothetical protein
MFSPASPLLLIRVHLLCGKIGEFPMPAPRGRIQKSSHQILATFAEEDLSANRRRSVTKKTFVSLETAYYARAL